MSITIEGASQIEQQIYRRAGGRIQNICVHVDQQRVVIYGDAPTYHTMQLAVAATAELFPNHEVINAIEIL